MPITFSDDFPMRLQDARARRKLTQQQLADLAGISRRRLAGYENGESLPKRSTLLSIASALGVPPAWLTGAPENFYGSRSLTQEIVSEPRVQAASVLIPGELAEKLKKEAGRNGRTLNAEVSRRLSESLDKADKNNGAVFEATDEDAMQAIRDLHEATERFLKLRKRAEENDRNRNN